MSADDHPDLQPCPSCGIDPDYTDISYPKIHVFCGNTRCLERPAIATTRGPLIAARAWNRLR